MIVLKGYTKKELEHIREKNKQSMQEITVKLCSGDAARIAACMEMKLLDYQNTAEEIKARGEELPFWLIESISEKNNIIRIMTDAMKQPSPARKQPPVDRGKLMIALECCRYGCIETCMKCPYFQSSCDRELMDDALAYISYLEERLEVTGL